VLDGWAAGPSSASGRAALVGPRLELANRAEARCCVWPSWSSVLRCYGV